MSRDDFSLRALDCLDSVTSHGLILSVFCAIMHSQALLLLEPRKIHVNINDWHRIAFVLGRLFCMKVVVWLLVLLQVLFWCFACSSDTI